MGCNHSFFNPYHDQNFAGFILQFLQRLTALVTGQLSFQELVSDEIQVFVLVGVAISSALVGTFLVLRRMTMLANSLSHTILMGIVLAYVMTPSSTEQEGVTAAPMQAMLVASLITGFLTTFLTEFLTKVGRLQEDASTGLVFTSFFALGVILVTILTRDAHIGTEAVMGNADALHRFDLFWVYVIAGLNACLFMLFFKEFKLTTFDPSLAYALGFSPFAFNYLLPLFALWESS
jgi:manganese/zinc/iron transport system permease protein